MSLIPGLGLSTPAPQQAHQVAEERAITLTAGSEWRFEVAANTTVSVRLLPSTQPSQDNPANNGTSDIAGTAEVFGSELAPNHTYDFSALTKTAVHTHHGCTLSVTGACESEYTAEETPMTQYTNLHFALENMRNTAAALPPSTSSGGPRVLVLGPKDSGKSSLIKLLTSYAVRSNRTPLVVNLDPSEGMLCCPGGISAAVMGTGAVLDVEDAASGMWGSSPIGGPSAVPVKNPLVYHYGFATPEERPDTFRLLSSRLALAATSRFEEDEGVREAGMLVDIAGSVVSGKAGYDIVSHVISEFSINVLLILGSERLYSDMSKRFAPASSTLSEDDRIHVLRLPKSGGCVDRDESYMRALRQAQVRAYFFGSGPKNALSPHTLSVGFEELPVLRMGDPNANKEAYDQFLPGSDEPAASTTSPQSLFTLTNPSLALQSAFLTLKSAELPRGNATLNHDAIRDTPVLGYLYVVDIDEAKKRFKVLSPVGGRLPSGIVAVWGAWDGEIVVGAGGLLGG